MISFDHERTLPRRTRVESLLRELVRQPKYQKGALFPEEMALAAQLGVSRGKMSTH